MKPFNLERALAGDPVVTRGGRPVTQLTIFKDVDQDPLVGVLDLSIRAWKKDTGKYYDNGDHPYDLFMAPVKREGWINIYPKTRYPYSLASVGGEIYTTKEIAGTYAEVHCVGCIRVEWEE